MKKIVNIGIVGFGTVGEGVYQLIKNNAETIALRSGIDLRVKTICDLRSAEIRKKITGNYRYR